MPTSQRPSRRTPGVGSRPAQPKRSAPSRRHSSRPRELNGSPVSGSSLGLVADAQLDRVEAGRDGELVHRALERVEPGVSPGARIHDGVGTSSAARRWPVRRLRRRVEHPRRHRGLLGELLERRGLLERDVVDRQQAAVGVGAEPHALDRRRPVAGEREHLLAGGGELHRPVDVPGRQRRRDRRRPRDALRAEAAADVRRDHAHACGIDPERVRDDVPRARGAPCVES